MDIKIPNNILKGTFSGSKKNSKYIKGKIQRINLNNQELIQISLFTEKQVFHKNYTDHEIENIIIELLSEYFNNLELFTNEFIYSYRITSKGKILSNKHKNNQELLSISHNKQKNYQINEGDIVSPLVDLGVMTADGKIVKANYDKFKQINRFLEIINDSIKDEKNLKIIDFGCGKSYLTFILYYYLVEIKKINATIIGLDLKEDVINYCNNLSKKYNYSNLEFICKDIKDYTVDDNIDMIISLHACDTATDYALYHAINIKCKYIFSVPCCQHEINNTMDNNYLHSITKYGILKDRLAAIYTDAIRADILNYCGYKTQIMEFVDFENSPKNLLIRSIYTGNKNIKIKEDLDKLIKEVGCNQTLYDLIMKKEEL